MLDDLPPEVLLNIIGYLPSATAIVSLARVCWKLHTIICGHDSTAYRLFTQRAFPSIKTPAAWREAAELLTSRSRAWDRRALVVRDCCPPETLSIASQDNVGRRLVTGYAPALDSYENFQHQSFHHRSETVAWGAAGRIYLRCSDKYSAKWHSIKFEDDHVASNDILQLRLLRPHQRISGNETIIFRRDNGEVAALEATKNESGFDQYARFVDTDEAHTMSVSDDMQPILAVAGGDKLQLYPVLAQESLIQPSVRYKLEQKSSARCHTRCMQFLNSNHLALSTAFLEGLENGPITIYDVNQASVNVSAVPIWSCVPAHGETRGRQCARAIAPLDHTCGNSGQVFLSGWSSGHARLHDTRCSESSIADWYDSVDNGQVLSIAAIGHEKFLAGSDQNACLKTFDLRMPGDHRYSYLDARPPSTRQRRSSIKQDLIGRLPQDRRDFNVFLTVRRWGREQLWGVLPLPKQHNGTIPYSGSVYSLSVPSPTSPTVYAGIQNHVLQIDLANTDDLQKGNVDPLLYSLKAQKETAVFDVACYERPRKGRESTDPVLLNKQAIWHELKSQPERNEESEAAGWDRRWRLGGTRRRSWTRGGGRGRGGHRESIVHRYRQS